MNLEPHAGRSTQLQADARAIARRRRIRRDLLICAIVGLAVMTISVRFELMEAFMGWARTHEDWAIDELFSVFVIATAAGALFAWKQSQELRSEIVEREEYQRQLAEREEQLYLYAAHSPAAIAMFDRDMKYLVASRRWAETYRLGDQPIVGRSHYELFPDVPQRWLDVHRRCLAGAVETCDEDAFRRPDGRIDWIRWEVRPWNKADGTIGGIIIFSEDVTARKQSEEAVRAAEERTRFVLESANVGIWNMDYSTGVVHWSEISEAHFGLEPGTFRGTFEAFIDRVHPADRAHVRETVGVAMKAGGSFTVRHRVIWPNGSIRWIHGVGHFYLADDGRPLRAVGLSMDVTEHSLLEDQYRQSQKMEAVGRLAGGVAHDFNNLLTAILGYCDFLLADLGPNDPRRADVSEIHKAGSSATALTRQLLAFSRKQIIQPTLLDLNDVIGNLRAILGRLLGEDITINLALRPQIATVRADRGQIEQVIMNLAINARDAMPHGGALSIETENVEFDDTYARTHYAVKPGSYVALAVTDSGTGMTPEVQARLFEPFFTTKGQGKGTGLGLATVHGIVAQSGGTVGVYSEVGKGTTFRVYLPRAAGEDVAAETPAATTREPAMRQQTVLVVEDAHGLGALAKRLLERQGCQVLLAESAEEALQIVETHPHIDILLTDVVMPGASGPELAQRLLVDRPDLKVIYMSGYTEEAIVHHGVLNPGVAFLQKPFSADALGRKIREVVSGVPARAA